MAKRVTPSERAPPPSGHPEDLGRRVPTPSRAQRRWRFGFPRALFLAVAPGASPNALRELIPSLARWRLTLAARTSAGESLPHSGCRDSGSSMEYRWREPAALARRAETPQPPVWSWLPFRGQPARLHRVM